jgi:hypothetical protein
LTERKMLSESTRTLWAPTSRNPPAGKSLRNVRLSENVVVWSLPAAPPWSALATGVADFSKKLVELRTGSKTPFAASRSKPACCVLMR